MAGAEKVTFHEYFCTVGSGLEKFCSKELMSLGSTTVFDINVGKVFFFSGLPVQTLLSLKTIERLFLLVHKEPQFLVNHPKRESIRLFRAVVENHYGKWDSCLKKWSEFQILDGDKYSSIDGLSFRVSCKCSGKIKNAFPPAFLGKILAGSLLNTRTKWTTNLRNPQLEVLVHASTYSLIIGFACCPTSSPLSKRPYLPSSKSHKILRPTICYAMLYTGLSCHEETESRSNEDMNELCEREKKPDFKRRPLVILDPMCGTGIILAEAVSWPGSNHGLILLGGDSDTSQLREASSNILSALSKQRGKLSSNVDNCAQTDGTCIPNLFMADARALPLKDNSVDIIISDIPFGLKHRSQPWKKDLLQLTKLKTSFEANEFHSLGQPQSCKPFAREEYSTCDKTSKIQEVDIQETNGIESSLDVLLDASVEKMNSVDVMAKTEFSTQLTNIGKKSEKLISLNSCKRRKTQHENTDSVGVIDVKNMLPNLVAEMDRVLMEGGRAVLLISETLRSCLLETVNTVTNSNISLNVFGQHSDLHNSQKYNTTVSSVASSSCVDTLDLPANGVENREKKLLKDRHGWVCSEQHNVKLGILDAVICVFIK